MNEIEYDNIKKEIKQILKKCTIINFKVVPWYDESNIISNSMGNPYFEKNESWPISSKTGKPLHFVFQVFNDNSGLLPNEIGLLQLYVDLENIPFEDNDEGFIIKTYNKPNKAKAISLANHVVEKSEMAIWELKQNVLCGPSWEDVPNELVDKIIDYETKSGEDELFNDMKYELNCDNAMKSKFSGYPGWYQGVPASISKSSDFEFLLDIHTGLKWCWMGAVYLFWDRKNKKCRYFFQST